MWNKFTIIIGIITSFLTYVYGKWDSAMNTLLIVMAVDYVLALICAAQNKSKKSEQGGLHSQAGWKGLCAKGMSLIVILIAHRVDLMFGGDYCRIAITTGFILNEIISIIEYCGILGIPLPDAVTKMIDVLKDRANDESTEIKDNKSS